MIPSSDQRERNASTTSAGRTVSRVERLADMLRTTSAFSCEGGIVVMVTVVMVIVVMVIAVMVIVMMVIVVMVTVVMVIVVIVIVVMVIVVMVIAVMVTV